METNPYKSLLRRKTKLRNLGYDYRGQILRRSLSSVIYLNENVAEFVERLETIMTNLVYSVKSIKKSVNFLVDKDEDYIN